MFGVAALSLPRVFLFSSSSSGGKIYAATTGGDSHTNEVLCELGSLSRGFWGARFGIFRAKFYCFSAILHVMCLFNHIGECKLLARSLQFLTEHWDDSRKWYEFFIDFIQDQIAVPILSKKFQTELNEVLNYVDRIKVQNSIP